MFAFLRSVLLLSCVFVRFVLLVFLVLFVGVKPFGAFCACKVFWWKQKNEKFKTALITSFILLLNVYLLKLSFSYFCAKNQVLLLENTSDIWKSIRPVKAHESQHIFCSVNIFWFYIRTFQIPKCFACFPFLSYLTSFPRAFFGVPYLRVSVQYIRITEWQTSFAGSFTPI